MANSKEFFVDHRNRDQGTAHNNRSGMELEQTNDLLCLAGIVGYVIGCQPELIQPDINQQYCHEAGQVENVLFHRDRPAHSWRPDAQSCAGFEEDEELIGKEKIQTTAERN